MATITGNNFNDSLFGSASADRLSGGNGSDGIFGGDGNDVIFGGNGDDIISDGAGVDKLNGGNGNDKFILHDNNRFDEPLFNPAGMPQIFGGNGHDVIDASEAVEAIRFAAFTFAIASIEEVFGSQFGDVIDGSSVRFDLILHGAKGDDTLIGGRGDDIISGGDGNDVIQGGAGADLLTGGVSVNPASTTTGTVIPTNNDTFVFANLSDSQLSGFDVIQDLELGRDIIDAATPVAANDVAQLGSVTSLRPSAIADVLSPRAFVGSSAATFGFGDRTFLALNDGVAGFQANSDAIIEITGYSGNLSDLSVV